MKNGYLKFICFLLGVIMCAATMISCSGPAEDTENVSSEITTFEETTAEIVSETEKSTEYLQPLKLTVENSVTVMQGRAGMYETGLEYGRILEIRHSKTGKNGTLLLTFEEFSSGNVPGFPLYKSTDKGDTWKSLNRIFDKKAKRHPCWMPVLFELPCDMGEYEEGTILCGACMYGSGPTTLCLLVSTDLGKNWKYIGDIAAAGNVGGVYEPYFVMLDNGTLACYYADETDSKHAQKIVYRTTKDLVNWSDSVDVVAVAVQSSRPGMPVVTQLGDGRYFMVYEIVDSNGARIYYRYSDDGLDWGKAANPGKLISAKSDGVTKYIGSGPFCAWSEQGGENGTLIATAMYMEKGSLATSAEYFISNDYGATWKTVKHPIKYTLYSKFGYSNSFLFSADGKYLYAVNNPEGEVKNMSKIEFARVLLRGQ